MTGDPHHRGSRVRRRAIVLFVLLLPVAAWSAWDYVEARRLSRAVAEIRRASEPVTTLRKHTRIEDTPGNAARFYDAAGALLDQQPLFEGKDSILQGLRYGRQERSEVIARIAGWLEQNAEAERLLERATDAEFLGFAPGTEYNYRSARLFGLARMAGLRRLERVAAGDGTRAARAVVTQLRLARTESKDSFDLFWWDIEQSLAELGAVLESKPTAPALEQLAKALAERDRDSQIADAALQARAYLIDSFWSESSDWYGRPAIRFSANPLEPALYLLLRPWFAHKVNNELRSMNAAVEHARQPWPQRATVGPEPVVVSPARYFGVRFDHPVQVASAMQYRRVQWMSRRLAAVRAARVAVEIERYRLAHGGALPATLHEVAPALSAGVPIDPFSGAPVKLVRLDDRYIVYSFGSNRKDEGGRQLTAPTPKAGTRDQLGAAPDIGVEVVLDRKPTASGVPQR